MGGGKKLYIIYITHRACFAHAWHLIISRKSIVCILKKQVKFFWVGVGRLA